MLLASIVFASLLILGLVLACVPDSYWKKTVSDDMYTLILITAFFSIMVGGIGTVGHHIEWYQMAFEYRAYKTEGEVLQTTIDHARAESLDWETATMTTKLVDYNTKLAYLKLANMHNFISPYYIDDRVMDLPMLK